MNAPSTFHSITEQDWLRHDKHFPSGADLTLQVLKGHLLVEELLREIFSLQLPFPEALKGNRGTSFECHQIICLVQAITLHSDKEPWLWDAAKRLNGIRNDLAHKLEPKALDTKIQSLIQSIMDNPVSKKVVAEQGLPEGREFELIVLAMCSCLSSLKAVLMLKALSKPA